MSKEVPVLEAGSKEADVLAARSELQKMVAGELYDASDQELAEMRIRCRDLLNKINSSVQMDMKERLDDLYSELFGSCVHGKLSIQPPFFCDYGSNIHFGAGCYMNFNNVILDVCEVRIGERTLFGPSCQIYTASHPLDPVVRRKLEDGRPVTIGKDCWFGGSVVVLPGVTIGDRVVVGAGSVVTKDIPSDSLVVGNPARVIRKIERPEQIDLEEAAEAALAEANRARAQLKE